MLGGHTFTCSRCGSRVTIRDLRAQPDSSTVVTRSAPSFKRWSKPSSTPLLDQIIRVHSRPSMPNKGDIPSATVLIVAAIWVWRWSKSPTHPAKDDIFDRASPIPGPNLQDAIPSGTITAVFSGNGGSSGDSVRMRVVKGPSAGPGPVDATIQAGSVLVSSDRSAQSMMVTGVRGIDLG